MIEIKYAKVAPQGVDIDAGRVVADDPDAPRRSLGLSRVATPGGYVGSFTYDYQPPEPDEAWESAYYSYMQTQAAAEEMDHMTTEDRLQAYDGMPDDVRSGWDARWRMDARAWLDATAAAFDGGDGTPSGWHEVDQIETVDGGRLLVFAYQEQMLGVAVWFEAIRFGLGEVSGAAGIVEPSLWDVR